MEDNYYRLLNLYLCQPYYNMSSIIMIDNSHSYKYIYIDGIKSQYIDMIYILTLENSNRISNNISNRIFNYNITIQVNKGYKNCKKQLYKQTSIYDINDAFYHCSPRDNWLSHVLRCTICE